MKTIEEVANDYVKNKYGEFALLDVIGEDTSIKDLRNDFIAGVEFATKWINVDDELPQIGEKVITKMNKDKRTSYGIATRIREEWEIDAHWIDHTFSNMTITHWRYIDLK